MGKPTVSVLMPFYDSGDANVRKGCEQAIRSIARQSYKDFEIVLVVSGRRDFAKNLAKRGGKLRVFFLGGEKHGLGRRVAELSRARNFGIGKSRGKYIAMADSDDISLPGRLKRQVDVLEKNPHVGVLGSSMEVVDGGCRHIANRPSITEGKALMRAFLRFNPIYQPTVIARKAILGAVGGYRNTLGEDYDLWARLLGKTAFMNLGESLVKYRIHRGSWSIRHRAAIIFAAMGTKRLAASRLGQKIGLPEILFNYLQLLAIPLSWALGEAGFERLVRGNIIGFFAK